MQRILLGLFALFLVAACSTPQATAPTTMSDKPDMAPMSEDFRATPPKAGPAPEIQLGDFQDFKLDNGLQVVLVENHKLPRVSYQLFIDVPTHSEGEYVGAGDMMGNMLRRATSSKSKEEIDEAIDFIGASLATNANGAFASTISKYKEQMMEMMAEVVLDAQFPTAEFDKVKSDAIAGLKASLASPDAIASRVRQAVSYGNHPFGELTTEETLNNVDLATIKNYYETYFVPNRSYLVMVGDLTRGEAEQLAKKHFASWESKGVPQPKIATPNRPAGVTVNFVPRSGSVQSTIVVGHPVELKPGTTKAIRASLVNSVLGGGVLNDRLTLNLREDKAYTYSPSSSISPSLDVGNFRASANVRNEVTDSAVTEILYELARISTEPISAEEISKVKMGQAGSFGRALESPQRIARYALNTVRYGLDRDFYPTYLKKVESSSASDLLEVAGDLMSPKQTHIVVVGEKAVAEKLAKFASNGKVNYYDANGQMIDMEEMAAPTDLTPKSVIEGYIKAIGGQTAIDAIKNYTMTMEASVQGQTMSQVIAKEGGDKVSTQMTMMGMVMADQRYNAGKARMVQQGQTMPDNPMINAALKEEARLFPVAELMGMLDKVSLDGVETINGTKAIVLTVTGDAGATQRYFDQETMLQIRQVKTQGPQKVTFDIGDYQEVGGVKFPHSLSITGMAPFPIEMKVTEAKVNTEIDQSLFSME